MARFKKISIVPGKKYKIVGNSLYFLKKYGTPNPQIKIERKANFPDENTSSHFMIFTGRAMAEGLPLDEEIYFGYIKNVFGEYVHLIEILQE